MMNKDLQDALQSLGDSQKQFYEILTMCRGLIDVCKEEYSQRKNDAEQFQQIQSEVRLVLTQLDTLHENQQKLEHYLREVSDIAKTQEQQLSQISSRLKNLIGMDEQESFSDSPLFRTIFSDNGGESV